jgi:hypothetical protein
LAKNSRPTAQKRAREKGRVDRQKEKDQRRTEARERRAAAPPRPLDEDPDIAGIRPGPQPRPDWLEDEPLEAEEPETPETGSSA